MFLLSRSSALRCSVLVCASVIIWDVFYLSWRFDRRFTGWKQSGTTWGKVMHRRSGKKQHPLRQTHAGMFHRSSAQRLLMTEGWTTHSKQARFIIGHFDEAFDQRRERVREVWRVRSALLRLYGLSVAAVKMPQSKILQAENLWPLNNQLTPPPRIYTNLGCGYHVLLWSTFSNARHIAANTWPLFRLIDRA